jgi:hypothetical protein
MLAAWQQAGRQRLRRPFAHAVVAARGPPARVLSQRARLAAARCCPCRVLRLRGVGAELAGRELSLMPNPLRAGAVDPDAGGELRGRAGCPSSGILLQQFGARACIQPNVRRDRRVPAHRAVRRPLRRQRCWRTRGLRARLRGGAGAAAAAQWPRVRR